MTELWQLVSFLSKLAVGTIVEVVQPPLTASGKSLVAQRVERHIADALYVDQKLVTIPSYSIQMFFRLHYRTS